MHSIPRPDRWSCLVLLAAAALAIAGWQRTRFLTDDAFIAFRYVANAHAGHGLCFNPPPFLPVEGCVNLLWLLCLLAVWAVTGVEPPQSAGWLSLLCGLGTMLLVWRATVRSASPAFGRATAVVVGVAMLALARNRTFVTWLSSGLETAMFDLFAVWWTLVAFRPDPGRPGRWLGSLAMLAALAELTRSDGMLLCLATVAIAAAQVPRTGAKRVLLSLSPLLLVIAQLAWRRSFYGEWLPNPYYAKVTAAWPESGLRWLYCFLLEHGGFPWLALAIVFLIARARPLASLPARCRSHMAAFVATGTWIAFVAYYTLQVGGDHFEYRPFAHLVPLCLAGAVAMLAALRWHPLVAIVCMLLLALATDGFGVWLDRALPAARDASFVASAAHVPAPVRPLFRAWDRCQAWLRLHFVGLRRELHADFCRQQLETFPPRSIAPVATPGDRPVLVVVNAGVSSWVLPDVAILDACGLTDWVVARTPPPAPAAPLPEATLLASFAAFDQDHDGRLDRAECLRAVAAAQVHSLALGVDYDAWCDLLLALHDVDDDGRLDAAEFVAAAASLRCERRMAHERVPPPGYLDRFRPNVTATGGRLQIERRAVPLTDAEIVRAERAARAALR